MINHIESCIRWDRSNEGAKLEDRLFMVKTGATLMPNHPSEQRPGPCLH